MKAILLVSTLTTFLISSIFARENPFFPALENKNLPITNNRTENKPPLTSMTYNFPDQSRILKEVTFTFQNLDGSLETRKLEIDQSIDWRSPLILSQVTAPKTSSIDTKTSPHLKQDFIQLINDRNRISLLTKDQMLRTFTLTDPETLVVDFKHERDFEPFEKMLNTSPYKKVKIAYHGKFARVTLTLDGHYLCKVTKNEQGAVAVCK